MTEYEIKYFPPGTFENVLKDYEEHDKTCSSIPHLWLAHKGGFTDIWELQDCDSCRVTFYTDGIKHRFEFDVDGEEYNAYYCDCCNRRLYDYEDEEDKE